MDRELCNCRCSASLPLSRCRPISCFDVTAWSATVVHNSTVCVAEIQRRSKKFRSAKIGSHVIREHRGVALVLVYRFGLCIRCMIL